MKRFLVSWATALLFATAIASPTVRASGVTITESQLSELKFFAQYAAAAYCNSQNTVGQPITCANNTCPAVQADGAITSQTFSGISSGTEGLIMLDPSKSLIVLAFKGTSNLRDVLTDVDFLFASCDDLVIGCQVHSGFLEAWQEVSTAVLAGIAAAQVAHPSYTVVVAGHSLGGAVATLAAAYLRLQPTRKGAIDIYTYGSPRVGNAAFATYVTSSTVGTAYRVTHVDDPVPRLPPILFGYRHTSPEYWLSTGNAMTTEYEPADVQVCAGTANIQCNGGTTGLNVASHAHYFEAISGCSAQELTLRRRESDRNSAISDQELETRLSMLARGDIAFANALGSVCVAT